MIIDNYEIRKLSLIELISAKKLTKELAPFFTFMCGEKKLGNKLCEYACLARYCLFKDNQVVFSNVFSVLKAISSDELCEIFKKYNCLFKINKNFEKTEFCFNESFEKQILEEF
ncbi:MAG: hypothetical protein RSA99_04020 [Oscillospiraceae bacterium]